MFKDAQCKIHPRGNEFGGPELLEYPFLPDQYSRIFGDCETFLEFFDLEGPLHPNLCIFVCRENATWTKKNDVQGVLGA